MNDRVFTRESFAGGEQIHAQFSGATDCFVIAWKGETIYNSAVPNNETPISEKQNNF